MTSPTPPLPLAQVDRLLVWRYIFAGLCASLESVGLARFAFTPLIPELIHAGWFAQSAVVYLGAANLAGYVVGALAGRPIAARMANEHVLRLMMVLIAAAFFGCALPLSFAWYFGWRFLSGVAGGVVMVLVAGTILPHVPAARKGAAGGAIFLGLGLGIAGSGTIIPLLLELGLAQTWIGLGVLSLVLTAVSWFAWPASVPARTPHSQARHAGLPALAPAQAAAPGVAPAVAPASARVPAISPQPFSHDVRVLYVQYILLAGAALPHMVFLVDFIARGLGQGAYVGSVFWAVYGLGAIAGPPLYGYLADRLGPRVTIRIVTVAIVLDLLGFYVVDNLVALGVLTVIVGTFAPGIVPLVLARAHELVPHGAARQSLVWTRLSVMSASGLAISAYGFSALFNASGGHHRVLFLVAALMMLTVLLLEAAGKRSSDTAVSSVDPA
ncbi:MULTISPECIES: YbfB/YjiJ family MFS transporter [unclassified Achromobacter]|uniref:YbfB/YjiJ family MFS transporter n=1 Tax=unclassified Achromobacter TaxID=2626865 RepID=UPI000B5183D3|nr:MULTISPECIES: YbfB/YjiJ family MFS transporter [unclassified Achromobacter]OWT68839.1 MFS transporter [Achromobacter sp. HZ28]OWT78598.1 MFS transporter [Achromobacter sp. HZ34]